MQKSLFNQRAFKRPSMQAFLASLLFAAALGRPQHPAAYVEPTYPDLPPTYAYTYGVKVFKYPDIS